MWRERAGRATNPGSVYESRSQDYSYTSDFFLSGATNFPARSARLCFRGVFKWFLVVSSGKKGPKFFGALFFAARIIKCVSYTLVVDSYTARPGAARRGESGNHKVP